MKKTGFLTAFWGAFWTLAKPDLVSPQRRKGLSLLATVIGLSIAIVALEVQFNLWNKDFYNALEKKDQAGFLAQLLRFTVIAVFWIIAGVYRIYLQQMLQIESRTWLHPTFLAEWLRDPAHYRLELAYGGIAHPDQR